MDHNKIRTYVSTGGEIYPARLNPQNRHNGWYDPYFTLETVRKLAADLQQEAALPGCEGIDTIHVIDSRTDIDGAPQAVVVHVRWRHLDDMNEPTTTVVRPDADGLYGIGSYEWTWSQVKDGPAEAVRRAADRARVEVLREGARQVGHMLHQLAPEATGAGFVIQDGHPHVINVVAKERVIWTDDEADEGVFDCERLGGAEEALRQALQYGTSPETLQAAGWHAMKNDQGFEAYAVTFRPKV
ncbi:MULTISPECIES: hypothetical protein [unclassified Streptomyces]|uniref:hypothetical protein n=1 Tax=unclassified Streptomyces TaxID=2593676 RepID=UPI0035E08A5E